MHLRAMVVQGIGLNVISHTEQLQSGAKIILGASYRLSRSERIKECAHSISRSKQ